MSELFPLSLSVSVLMIVSFSMCLSYCSLSEWYVLGSFVLYQFLLSLSYIPYLPHPLLSLSPLFLFFSPSISSLYSILHVAVSGGVHFDLLKRVMRDTQRTGQNPNESIQQVYTTVFPMYKVSRSFSFFLSSPLSFREDWLLIGLIKRSSR